MADLPLILALSRQKTLAGAAESLEVDLSTVFRRLNGLEKRLRVRLFDHVEALHVIPDPNRSGGKVTGFRSRRDAALHKFRLIRTGLNQDALDAVVAYLQDRHSGLDQ